MLFFKFETECIIVLFVKFEIESLNVSLCYYLNLGLSRH